MNINAAAVRQLASVDIENLCTTKNQRKGNKPSSPSILRPHFPSIKAMSTYNLGIYIVGGKDNSPMTEFQPIGYHCHSLTIGRVHNSCKPLKIEKQKKQKTPNTSFTHCLTKNQAEQCIQSPYCLYFLYNLNDQ